jgi:hypothetical protein
LTSLSTNMLITLIPSSEKIRVTFSTTSSLSLFPSGW